MNKKFLIDNKVIAYTDEKMNNETVKKLWKGFTLSISEIEIKKGNANTFIIGSTTIPILNKDKEYALRVDQNGIAIVGRDYQGLMQGFKSLLMKIQYESALLSIKSTTEESQYTIKNRMIHICVFPENDLYFIKKQIRFAALCQYTHIVIEFWGMFKYDCLKELAWPQAFTKEQVKELVNECYELGIEPVPMFNQLGHASASRLWYGKHVVLDQNPLLQDLFTPDGWNWKIDSDAVFELLKNVRQELYEVFDKGEYIHIGCDEAYYITRNEKLRKILPDYLEKLTKEVENEGRRPMMWMDMLLEKNAFKCCYSVGEKDEVENIRKRTAKSTVFVDWQYDCTEIPIPSLASLNNTGRDVIGAPWFNEKNYEAHIKTIKENDLFGLMLTTWDKLPQEMPHILKCAKLFGAQTFPWSEFSGYREEGATLLRKLSFEGNTYAECGWIKAQVGV